MIDWMAREKLETEYWGNYDSVTEAYHATTEDARGFAEDEAQWGLEEAVRRKEENHQGHVFAYYCYKGFYGLNKDGSLGDIPF